MGEYYQDDLPGVHDITQFLDVPAVKAAVHPRDHRSRAGTDRTPATITDDRGVSQIQRADATANSTLAQSCSAAAPSLYGRPWVARFLVTPPVDAELLVCSASSLRFVKLAHAG